MCSGAWGQGWVAGRIRRRSIRATAAFEIVSGKVGELASKHALQASELPHAEANRDDGVTGQGAGGAEYEALKVVAEGFFGGYEGFEEEGVDLGLDGAEVRCDTSRA